jgi:hypothetical protein
MYYSFKPEKYSKLIRGERYFLYSTKYANHYFVYRLGPVPGIHKHRWNKSRMWRSQSVQEKRKWYDFVDQFKQISKTVNRRRNAKSLISTYDDIPINHYRGSWKHSTKKRRQWGGEIEFIYCG